MYFKLLLYIPIGDGLKNLAPVYKTLHLGDECYIGGLLRVATPKTKNVSFSRTRTAFRSPCIQADSPVLKGPEDMFRASSRSMRPTRDVYCRK